MQLCTSQFVTASFRALRSYWSENLLALIKILIIWKRVSKILLSYFFLSWDRFCSQSVSPQITCEIKFEILAKKMMFYNTKIHPFTIQFGLRWPGWLRRSRWTPASYAIMDRFQFDVPPDSKFESDRLFMADLHLTSVLRHLQKGLLTRVAHWTLDWRVKYWVIGATTNRPVSSM